MAIIYGKNTAVDYAAGNLASFGKSYSRMGAAPLDMYEVWYDLAELRKYASFRGNDANGNPVYDGNTEVVDTSAVTSYVGQKVAYVDDTNGKIYHYSIELDGSLKEIGVAPTGDGKSITVSADGVVSILGIDAADSLTLPRMKEDKSGIEWVPVSAVVEGDGNDNTTYTFTPLTKGEGDSVETYGFIVKTFFNGTAVEGGEFTFSFDVYTKSEVDAAIKVLADKIGVEAAEGVEATGLYELIANEVTRATGAESALSDRIGVAKNGEAAATGVYAYVDGVVEALVNGVDADKIDSLNELIAWVEAHPAIVEELDGRLDNVEAILEGFGGEEEPATVKGYVDDAFDAHELAADGKYATKQEITDAGYAVAAEIERDYVKKATTLEGYGITDAYTKNQIDEKIGTPGAPAIKDGEGNVTTEAVPGTGVFASTYSKAELNALLDEIEGGSTESAASVARQLDEYKTSNNERVKGIEDKVGKDVNGEEPATGLFLEVDEARKVADEAKSASTKNANDIAALQGNLGTTNTNVTSNTEAIAAINTNIGTNVTPKIAALEAADVEIEKTLGEHTAALELLNVTKIPAIEQSIINEAKARDDADKAILAKIGTVEEGKTVVEMIGAVAESVGKIDFSPYAKKDEVAATYATIASLEAIYKAGEGEAEATGVLAEEIARAKAAEKKLSDDLSLLINNPTEDLDSVVEIIEHVKANGTAVTGIISRLDGHDAILAGIGGEGETATVKKYVDDAIAAIPAYELPVATAEILGGIKSAKDVVDGETTSIAVDAVYVGEDGVGTVKAISTDTLVQGKKVLVLNGGDASGI